MTRRNVTDGQYGMLMRRLAELVRRVDEGTIPFEPTMTAIQRIIDGKQPTKDVGSLFSSASDLCVSRATKRFVVREHFGNPTASVLTVVYDNFKDDLLDFVEENVPEELLKVRRMQQSAADITIINGLREVHELAHETKLAHIWNAIESHSLQEHENYLFYVRDVNLVLWSLRVFYSGGCWRIFVRTISDRTDIPTGWLVISR